MKRLLIMAIVAVGLSSCSKYGAHPIDRDEPVQTTSDDQQTSTDAVDQDIN